MPYDWEEEERSIRGAMALATLMVCAFLFVTGAVLGFVVWGIIRAWIGG